MFGDDRPPRQAELFTGHDKTGNLPLHIPVMQLIADLIESGDPALLLYDKITFMISSIEIEDPCSLPPADEFIKNGQGDALRSSPL